MSAAAWRWLAAACVVVGVYLSVASVLYQVTLAIRFHSFAYLPWHGYVPTWIGAAWITAGALCRIAGRKP